MDLVSSHALPQRLVCLLRCAHSHRVRMVYYYGLAVWRGRFGVLELVGGFYPVVSIRRVDLWDESYQVAWDYNMSDMLSTAQ